MSHPVVYLLRFAVRGHRLPPDPRGLSADQILAEQAWRARPTATKRQLSPELRQLVVAVVRGLCERRGGRFLAAAAGPTCLLAVVELPNDLYGLVWNLNGFAEAVRTVSTRRARWAHAWPLGERVFTPRVECAKVPDDGVAGAVEAVRVGVVW